MCCPWSPWFWISRVSFSPHLTFWPDSPSDNAIHDFSTILCWFHFSFLEFRLVAVLLKSMNCWCIFNGGSLSRKKICHHRWELILALSSGNPSHFSYWLEAYAGTARAVALWTYPLTRLTSYLGTRQLVLYAEFHLSIEFYCPVGSRWV